MLRNGSCNGNANGVWKRQRLTGTVKRHRRNGNGMVETGHYPATRRRTSWIQHDLDCVRRRTVALLCHGHVEGSATETLPLHHVHYRQNSNCFAALETFRRSLIYFRFITAALTKVLLLFLSSSFFSAKSRRSLSRLSPDFPTC